MKEMTAGDPRHMVSTAHSGIPDRRPFYNSSVAKAQLKVSNYFPEVRVLEYLELGMNAAFDTTTLPTIALDSVTLMHEV